MAAYGQQNLLASTPAIDRDSADQMTAADKHSADGRALVWRDPVWLGAVGFLVVTSAALIGAIAGRAFAGIDIWALGVGGAAAAASAATSLAILEWRQQAVESKSSSFDQLVEGLSSAGAAIDSSGRALAANDEFRRLFPDSDHAPFAMLKRRLGGNDEASDLIGRMIASAASGVFATDDVRVDADDSDIEWMRISAMPLSGHSGSALWTFEDITERRNAQLAIDQARVTLGEFIEHAPVGCYSVDQEGRFLLVNAVLASWLGYAPGAMEAQDLRLHDLLVDPSEQTPAFRVAGREDDNQAGVERRVQLRCLGGDTLPVAITQTDIFGEDGTLRTSSIVRHVPPDQAAQRALARGEHRFEAMFENAPVGIVLLDHQGCVTESNYTWRMLAAPGEDRLIGRSIAEFVADDDSDKVKSWLDLVINDDAPVVPHDVVLRTETEIGTPRIATMYLGRLNDEVDDGGGLIVHFHEATEQRSLEEQFAQSQKMQAVGQLAGGVAHDFNNLLTAMIGFCDLLLLRHTPGDQSFGDIMQIKQNANRAARLVRQLLAFSRQQTLQPRVLSITDVVGDLTSLLRRLIGANIKLDITHGRDLGLVRVDQGQLEQVVINLAVNARDAMRDGGELTIRTYNESVIVETQRVSEVVMPGDYVVIETADTGGGIAPELLERIFEPFFTTKEVGAGTGLGLSTVYGIVKQTGGQIFVDSAPGQGAKFTIMIPRYEADSSEEVRKPESAEGVVAVDTTGAGTILLVEDEDAVRLFSARALRAKGYKVLEARTGEAALELLDVVDDFIDLMITDAMMPEMDGPTLIKEMREQRPDLPVICISGYAEETFRDKLGESDDIHFLPKPFSLDQLAGRVKDVMSQPVL